MFSPLFIDLQELLLSDEEKELIQNPLVGGVILFARNCDEPEQILALTKAIRSIKKDILISVDQEGGRVQRIKKGVTLLPALRCIGEKYDESKEAGLKMAYDLGVLMAKEMLALGIDFSFAPVLDLDKGISQVIGDRAFHRDPLVVGGLAKAYTKGMNDAGMISVGKHFPGHGSVSIDSHLDIPMDERGWDEIAKDDLMPFQALIENGIQALMPAHIIFPQIDTKPVGFSKIWLQDILRKKLGFKGIIISDDLSMKGASSIGDYPTRAKMAISAGCDKILVCNNRAAVHEVLATLGQIRDI